MTSTIARQFTQDTTYDGPLADVCCDDRDRWCGERDAGFLCSRQRGHDAEHVASGSNAYQYRVWPQPEAPAEPEAPTFTVHTTHANLDEVYDPAGAGSQCRMPRRGYVCTRSSGHDGVHVASGSGGWISHVWEPGESPVDDYKRQVREMALTKCQQGYGDYRSWNTAMRKLGLAPLTKRSIRIVAPAQRAVRDMSDYSEEQARQWLSSRDRDTVISYMSVDTDTVGEPEVVVEDEAFAPDDAYAEEDERASTDDLDEYKELVREVGLEMQSQHSWCNDGTNSVLRDLGIEVERDFRVQVQIRAYQTVYVTVTAQSEEAAINSVDRYDISNAISSSDWEWDEEWDSDDMSAEEDD